MRHTIFSIVVIAVLPFFFMYATPVLVQEAMMYQNIDVTASMAVNLGTQIAVYGGVGLNLFLSTLAQDTKVTRVLFIVVFIVLVLMFLQFTSQPWIGRLLRGVGLLSIYTSFYGGILIERLIKARQKKSRHSDA